MKKKMMVAGALAAISLPGVAAPYTNLENPLYIPTSNEIYTKLGVGVMYKVADDTLAMQAKGADGQTEFPIWRLSADAGYGITNRLTVRAAVGYTQDDDINRKGMHHGRLGLNYRLLDGGLMNGIVLDVYGDAHLGGVSKMEGAYTPTGFVYDNYSNGRWGVNGGLQLGKTWNKFTAAVFGEATKTFGNDNNEIDVSAMGMGAAGIPDVISVDLKSTWEYVAGIRSLYEMNDKWSFGGSFVYKHRATNGVESVSTEITNPMGQVIANALAASMSSMHDGIDEYIVGAVAAYNVSECTQVALYGEYTFDDAEYMSQNGTDVKAEIGVRLNARF